MDALNHIDHGWTMPNLKMAPRNLGPWRIPTLNRNGVWWNGPKLSDFQALDFWIRGVGGKERFSGVEVDMIPLFLGLFQVFKCPCFHLTQRYTFLRCQSSKGTPSHGLKSCHEEENGRNTPVACLRMLSTKLHPQASLRSVWNGPHVS